MSRLVVLIPVFNDFPGLCASLDSLLASNLPPNAATVVVDDGSTEPINVPSFYGKALGLVVLRLEQNQGIERALNHGLREAARLGAVYLARLDAGDTIEVDRFQRQVTLLESNPEIGLVGASTRFVDDEGRMLFTFVASAHDKDIRRRMHMSSCILHPTAMFKMSVLDSVGFYSTEFPAAEDYELFMRMLGRCKAACVTDVLVTKVLAKGSISVRRRRAQLVSRLRIQLRYFDWRYAESYVGMTATMTLMAVPGFVVQSLKRLIGVSRY